MKITIYTITECPFSKSEKEYLTSKNLAFDEKNLETNKEFLTEMLSVSDNFAGVPFTLIVKDDGSEVKLKGFTKEDFEKELAVPLQTDITTEPQKEVMPAASVPAPADQSVVAPSTMTPPAMDPSAPSAVSAVPTTPPVVPQAELNGVLDTLSSLSQTSSSSAPSAVSETSTPPAVSSTGTASAPADGKPQVPDFN